MIHRPIHPEPVSPRGLNSQSGCLPSRRGFGFTLIELLVVMAIISILAALIIPIGKSVNRRKIIAKARAELAQAQLAIESYKSSLGHYPPDNSLSSRINQLYFELRGTTNTGSTYRTLDGSAEIPVSPTTIQKYFGTVNGFINCTQSGGSDEGRKAKAFLPDLKPGQIGDISESASDRVKILVCSVPWPNDPSFPIPGHSGLNPFRYNSSSPTNNPNAFDLWIDVIIDGKTNRISNWSQEPQVVSTPY